MCSWGLSVSHSASATFSQFQQLFVGPSLPPQLHLQLRKKKKKQNECEVLLTVDPNLGSLGGRS